MIYLLFTYSFNKRPPLNRMSNVMVQCVVQKVHLNSRTRRK